MGWRKFDAIGREVRILESANYPPVQAGLPYRGSSYVFSGASISAGTGLAAVVASGICLINGISVLVVGTVSLTASSTNYIFAQSVDTLISNVNLVANTTGTNPTGNPSVFLGLAITGVSTVSTTNTGHRGVIAPYEQLTPTGWATVGPSVSAGQRDLISFTLLGDGITNVKIETWTGLLNQSGVTGGEVLGRIYNGASATGTLFKAASENAVSAVTEADIINEVVVPAWEGLSTFYLNGDAATSGGHSNFSSVGATMRALWAPGLTPG